MSKYKIVSFIPARGGSKRIPRKNIRILAGKPMLAWTIEASLKSRYIDRTFVSTEDKEIKEIGLKYGAEVRDRPAEFSQGQDPMTLAYYHFKYCLWKEKYEPDYVVFLFPTSPLRTEKHIDEAFELYFKSDSSMLLSVFKARFGPNDLMFINESGKLGYILDINTRQRDWTLNPKIVYTLNSAIVIGPYHGTDDQTAGWVASSTQPYIMEPKDSIDVDTEFDFKVAEMLLKERVAKEAKKT